MPYHARSHHEPDTRAGYAVNTHPVEVEAAVRDGSMAQLWRKYSQLRQQLLQENAHNPPEHRGIVAEHLLRVDELLARLDNHPPGMRSA